MKKYKKYFRNRQDAAEQLLAILPVEKIKEEEWIILSTSSSGTPIAFYIAEQLKTQFDFLFTEKIFAPNNDESEIAIVSETQEVIIHKELVQAFDINLDFIFSNSKKIYTDTILKNIQKYRCGKKIINLIDKNVLLIDEGLNTSLTMMCCIKTAIQLGAKSVCVAVPILPDVSTPIIDSIADDLYFVQKLEHFISIDFYYDQLEKITYNDNLKMMKEKKCQ